MLGGLAGLVAAGMVVFSGDWVRSMMHGYTEPLLIGLLLGAVDRHLSERRGQAFLCLSVAALARPEVFALVVAYALLAFSGRERWRWLAVSIGIPLRLRRAVNGLGLWATSSRSVLLVVASERELLHARRLDRRRAPRAGHARALLHP